MAQIQLTVEPREKLTKGQRKTLREEGIIPGVVYGAGKSALMVKVPEKEIRRVFKEASSENVILTLTIAKTEAKKDAKKTVIVKDIQRDALRHRWLHVDFQEISLSEKLRTMVQVIPVGTAIGVAQHGGTLERILREVEVECLPADIPEKIEVDITNLIIGKSVYVKDLVVGEKVRILTDAQLTVLAVAAPQAEVEAVKPAEAQVSEPEVIREKKAEGEEAAEAKEGGKEKGKETPAKQEKKEEKKEEKEKAQK